MSRLIDLDDPDLFFQCLDEVDKISRDHNFITDTAKYAASMVCLNIVVDMLKAAFKD